MARLEYCDIENLIEPTGYHTHLGDCMEYMKGMANCSVDCVLTDIPYDGVNDNENRSGMGLRNMSKGAADELTFDLRLFLSNVYRIAKSTIIIFCGSGQVSSIYENLRLMGRNKGTVRHMIWRKTNPSPFNGEYIYLSSIENMIWFKKHGGTFNAFCKGVVFDHSTGSSKNHPTEKNHKLLRELMLDNTNSGDIIFDPCAGSFSTGLVALQEGRRFIGCELNEEYYRFGANRLVQYAKENNNE